MYLKIRNTPLLVWERSFLMDVGNPTMEPKQSIQAGACSHLDPDIRECEVKWALGSITMNKASGGDGIPVELFQILKLML